MGGRVQPSFRHKIGVPRLAQVRSHIFLDIHPPTSFSSSNGSSSGPRGRIQTTNQLMHRLRSCSTAIIGLGKVRYYKTGLETAHVSNIFALNMDAYSVL